MRGFIGKRKGCLVGKWKRLRGRMKQGRGMAWWALVVGVVLMGGQGQEAAQFEVGGSSGWTLPSIGNVNYSDWADSQTFVVGDTLYFNYSREYHNVMVVTKSDYQACEASSPISTYDDGATIVKLDRSGTFYFLCGIPSHCTDGQKVEVKVRKHALSSSTAPSTETSQVSHIIPSPIASPSPNAFPPQANIANRSPTSLSYFFSSTLIIAFTLLLNVPLTFFI
ncbi:hypothetical protein GOP47_0018775 [Adiantum capillus-veneris]|uniref:Phytocyanin domain-containing protein n=1 Tax=Adiantum capillus-veneris TaxID=13818 RepID=A0A9D4UF97_ADICA|nr:hypothetical protein GOP47_0018775 [Adiantum capillus-veneris]